MLADRFFESGTSVVQVAIYLLHYESLTFVPDSLFVFNRLSALSLGVDVHLTSDPLSGIALLPYSISRGETSPTSFEIAHSCTTGY